MAGGELCLRFRISCLGRLIAIAHVIHAGGEAEHWKAAELRLVLVEYISNAMLVGFEDSCHFGTRARLFFMAGTYEITLSLMQLYKRSGDKERKDEVKRTQL
jgi:hypothetical protein